MASYGGYTKPSYGADAAAEGGGYMAGSQSGSQGGQQRNYNADSLRPVTIKQLLEAEESYPGSAEFPIDGSTVTQLTTVGQVRAVNAQPTNVTYKIDDGTGQIDVKRWVEADADQTDEPTAPFALDQYVRVFGRLKQFNQKRFVAAHFVRAVDDYNEVSYHALECTYVHLALTRDMPSGANGANGANGHKNGEEGMFVEQDTSRPGVNLTPNSRKVYDFLRNMPTGNEGVNINVIVNELKLGYGPTTDAIQDLINYSLVFSTVDDETFALM